MRTRIDYEIHATTEIHMKNEHRVNGIYLDFNQKKESSRQNSSISLDYLLSTKAILSVVTKRN